MLGGDFNSRIANINQIDKNMFSSEGIFSQNRSSVDLVANARGDILVNIMESTGMFILNGRTPSESPTQITFIGYGKSVNALVWTSIYGLGIIRDIKVLHIATKSN